MKVYRCTLNGIPKCEHKARASGVDIDYLCDIYKSECPYCEVEKYVKVDKSETEHELYLDTDGNVGLEAKEKQPYILIMPDGHKIEVQRQDEPGLMTWHEATKGFGDCWRLPTKDELNAMYEYKEEIGGFADGYYWSSSEYSSTSAWLQYFSDGYQAGSNKANDLGVRAVRDIAQGLTEPNVRYHRGQPLDCKTMYDSTPDIPIGTPCEVWDKYGPKTLRYYKGNNFFVEYSDEVDCEYGGGPWEHFRVLLVKQT